MGMSRDKYGNRKGKAMADLNHIEGNRNRTERAK